MKSNLTLKVIFSVIIFVAFNQNIFAQANAGDDQYICTDSTTLNAELPAGFSGSWTFLAGDGNIVNPTLYNTKVSDLDMGENVLLWTITNGTSSFVDIVVITNNTPSLAEIITPDTTICGGTITLEAVAPEFGTGYWEQVAGSGMWGVSYETTIVVDGLSPNDNVFKWCVENGEGINKCSNCDFVMITNNEIEAYAGEDQIVCENSTFLNASNPMTVYPFQGVGYWQNLSGVQDKIVNSLDPQTEVIDLPSGESQFSWTVELGECVASDTVTINNNSVYAITQEEIFVCAMPVNLYAYDPAHGTGLWVKVNPNDSGVILDPTSYQTYITDLDYESTVLLNWIVTDEFGICSDTAEVSITNTDFEISAGDDQIVCSDTAILSGTPPGDGVGYWYLLVSGGIVENPTSAVTQVSNLQNGYNVFEWNITKNNGCNKSDAVVINNAKVVAYAGEDQIVCTDSTFLSATPQQAGETGSWFLTAGSANIENLNSYNTKVIGLQNGINMFEWHVENEFGCEDIDYVAINFDAVYANAGVDTSVCGKSVTFDASPYSEGFWTTLNGLDFGSFDDPTNPNTTFESDFHGEFSFVCTVENDNCSETDIVKINFIEMPVADAGPDRIVSESNAYLKAVNPYPYTGKWTSPNSEIIIYSPFQPKTKVGNLQYGNNYFLWTVRNGACVSSDKVKINRRFGLPSDFINIYPNPATDFITIDIKNYQFERLEITDITGKILIKEDIFEQKTEISISSLTSGIYFITLFGDENSTQKLIIE